VSQAERLIRYLEANPGASHIELTVALHLANVTGRVSDARLLLAPSRTIVCVRDEAGTFRYRVEQVQPEQLTWSAA
jgi:hypothetical protein